MKDQPTNGELARQIGALARTMSERFEDVRPAVRQLELDVREEKASQLRKTAAAALEDPVARFREA